MDKLTAEYVAIKKWFGMLPLKFQKLQEKKILSSCHCQKFVVNKNTKGHGKQLDNQC